MASAWGALSGGPASGGAWATSKPQPMYDSDDESPQRPMYNGPSSSNVGSSTAAPAAFANAFQPSTSHQDAGPDIVAMQAELQKKTAELADKEKKLKLLEKEMQASGLIKKKNWPICFPILYHNIAEEIPEKSLRVVREIYMCWYGLVICLGWNFFCASVILGTNANDKVASWFLAVIYAVLGIPLSFWSWYLAIYKAGKNDSTTSYVFFFLAFLVHTAFCVWAAVAMPFSGSSWSFAGWLTALVAFNHGYFDGIVYIVGACLWTCESLYCLWCLKDAYLFFRGQGGIQQAKQDVAIAAFRASLNQNRSGAHV